MDNIMNSWWMYLLGAIVVLFVLGSSIFFILKAFKDGKELNMDKDMLKKVVFNSAIFTILPSISILIGIIALAPKIGIPLPWIRLSVIGALQYEGTAALTVISDYNRLSLEAGGPTITSVLNNEMFVTIAFVMTLGIIVGPLFCLFGFEFYDRKVLNKTRENNDEEKEVIETTTDEVVIEKKKPKKDFGSTLFNGMFIAMISVFLSEDIAKLVNTKPSEDGSYVPTSYVPVIVIGVTFLSMYIFDILENKFKQKWLSSFSLGFSMLIGMASAAIVEWLVR